MNLKLYKIASRIFCTLIISIGFLAFSKTLALTEIKDQYYAGSGTGVDDMEDLDNFSMEQSFIPTLDNITKIRLEFAGSGVNERWQISINDVPGSRLKLIRGDIKNGWVDFVLDSPFSVTPGTTYKIEILSCGPTELGAVYTIPGGYARGEATTGFPAPNKDYHFETYGYGTVSDDSDENGTEESLPDEGMMMGDYLEPPSNLEAKPDNSKKCAVLTWNAIPNVNEMIGYSIFRSTKKDKDYKEVTSVSGDTEKYKDCDVELGKKYYYKIRSRDGASESKDSEIVNITLEEEQNNIWVYWLIGGGGGIFLILIIIYLILAKKKYFWPFRMKKAEVPEAQK